MARNRTDTPWRTARSRVSNGKQLFLDGQVRSKTSRRFRDILLAIASEIGGLDHMSTGQMQLARRCALISVTCEEMEQAAVSGKDFNIDSYGQLTDRLGRAFQRLGLKRQPRDATTLEAYLAQSSLPEGEEP